MMIIICHRHLCGHVISNKLNTVFPYAFRSCTMYDVNGTLNAYSVGSIRSDPVTGWSFHSSFKTNHFQMIFNLFQHYTSVLGMLWAHNIKILITFTVDELYFDEINAHIFLLLKHLYGFCLFYFLCSSTPVALVNSINSFCSHPNFIFHFKFPF